MRTDFAFIDELVPDIRWDAKYATWDNFIGKPVDGYLANRVVGTRALCAGLARAQEQAHSCGFGLLVWDAYRPQRAVDQFVRWSQAREDGRTKEFHYPNIDRPEMLERGYVAAKSGHSRGGAVDLTLFHLDTGELAKMGGRHDLMDSVSHHGAAGVAPAEARNRERLCTIMESSGFGRYDYEWWHYALRDEPHPHTYFDFPITPKASGLAA